MPIPTHVVRDETFGPGSVQVDDTLFIKCRFTQSKIIFEGTGPVSFDGCTFDRCDWVFDGPAEHALLYLTTLYHGLGDGGRELVEGIFESIRQGTVLQGQHIAQPQPALR